MEDRFHISFCGKSYSEAPSSSESATVQHQLDPDDLHLQLPKDQSPRQTFPPSPEDIRTYREENAKVVINVGGSKFEVKMWQSFILHLNESQ